MSLVDSRSERKRGTDAQNFADNRKAQTPRFTLFKALIRVWHFALRPDGNPRTGVQMALKIDPGFPQHFEEVRRKEATTKAISFPTGNGDKWVEGVGLNPWRNACRKLANILLSKPRAYSDNEINALILGAMSSLEREEISKTPGVSFIHIVSLPRIEGTPTKVGFTQASDPEDRLVSYQRMFGSIQPFGRIAVYGEGNGASIEKTYHSLHRASRFDHPLVDTECYPCTPEDAYQSLLKLCDERKLSYEAWRWEA